MDINLLNGNVLRYKKESCSATSSFWVAQDARGRVWAFEVGERSEVGALESLFIFILGCTGYHRHPWAFEVGERSEVGALESLSYLMCRLTC